MALFGIDLSARLWGVHLWIWIYLALSVVMFLFVLVYFYKEIIRKKYYEIRFPEKLLKIVMHYKSGYFKEYWRMIPETEEFVIDSKIYKYSDKKVLKDNEFYLRKKNAEITATIDGKEYNINDKCKLIKRWRSYPELHYFYNIPLPIDFDMSDKALEFSSKQMQEFKENDLFSKLLTLDNQNNILTFILILGVLNMLVSIFVLAKIMGWLNK